MLLSKIFPLLLLAASAFAANFTNPLRMNGPDPFIVWDDGYYYFLTTTYGDLEIARATTLAGLTTADRKVVYGTPAMKANGHVWAPEIHKLDGTWYMYYTGTIDEKASGDKHLGVHALKGGSSPWDAYEYSGLVTEKKFWSIDATVLHLNDNEYLVWSCTTKSAVSNKKFPTQSICIAKLLSPTEIGPHSVIAAPTTHWEVQGKPVNEGPQALYSGNRTFLTYSASYCAVAAYSLGLLEYQGGEVLDASSWYKYPKPVLSSNHGNYGPGHNGIFLSPDGTETWNVFHAVQTPRGSCGNMRYTMANKVAFDSEGMPVFGEIPYLGKVLEGPSGEPADEDDVSV